jgi:hypothetical protein
MPQADVERERQNSRYEQACEEFGAALDRLARAYAPQNAGKGGWSGPGPVVLAMLILVFFVLGSFRVPDDQEDWQRLAAVRRQDRARSV